MMVPQEKEVNPGNDDGHKAYLSENFTPEEIEQAKKELRVLGPSITHRDVTNQILAKRNGTNEFPVVDATDGN